MLAAAVHGAADVTAAFEASYPKASKDSKPKAAKKAASDPTCSALMATRTINSPLWMALKKAVTKGSLTQVKEKGALAGFTLNKEFIRRGREPTSSKKAEAPMTKTAMKRSASKTANPKEAKKPKSSSSKEKEFGA
ncbi:hypothetical protein KIN20_038316 [Parelaphostrongylus tenuis]|uniref:H15 domain-containing protein n=1 Tax=Parelaphostrongylus tenuis TaxID=148309 RepID=A0AAD5RFU3_PARTN|nr:hypothetical protein KIN20_038316 [Parelaphostrongylus tenuis]